MAEIKQQIKLQYIAEGLSGVKKALEEIKISGENFKIDPKVLEEINSEFKNLEHLLSSSKNGLFNLSAAKEIERIYGKILKDVSKLRESASKSILGIGTGETENIAKNISNYQEEIEKRTKEIARLSKEEERIKAGLSPKDPSIQDSSLEATGVDRMINPMSGQETKRFEYFNQKLTELTLKLKETEGINQNIVQRLSEGADLTEKELKYLNEVFEKRGDIKLSAEETLVQYQNQAEVFEDLPIEVEERLKTVQDEINDFLKFIENEGAELEKELQEIGADLPKDQQEKLQKLAEIFTFLSERFEELNENKQKIAKADRDITDEIKRQTIATEEQQSTFGKAAKQVFTVGSAYAILRRIYRETLRTIKEMDKALTGMTIITKMSREEAWKMVGTYQKLAKETGYATTEIANMTTEFLRQGRSMKDALELTDAAAKAARIAGISGSESINYLTSAINGFSLAADQAMEVSDKFAALAASSATSYEELAIGLSKFAAQAKVAGISIDFALGMLTKGVATTREAPETIGTAIKTVLSRMRELTDYGKTLEDGMNVNRVEKALSYIGVKLRDVNGKFRSMETVLTEVGQKWDTLNATQQASVAVALAGTRQQSRLIAIFNDFEKTLGHVQTARESEGETAAQHAEYMKGLEAALAQLTTTWQQLITTLTDSQVIVFVVNMLTGALQVFADLLGSMGGITKGFVIALGSLFIITKAISAIQGISNSKLLVNLGLKKAETAGTTKLIFAKRLELLTEKMKNKQVSRGLTLAGFVAIVQKQGLRNTIKQTIANSALAASFKATTAAVWKFTVALLANPIFLITSAVIGLAVGIGLAATATKRLTKALDEAKLAMYKFGQTINQLEELSEAIDRINNKPIKIQADLDELEKLEERIKEIEQEKDIKLISYRANGDIDWDETRKNLEKEAEKTQKEREKASKKARRKAKRLYKRGDIEASEYGKILTDDFVVRTGTDLSTEQRDALDAYAEALIKAGKKITDEGLIAFAKGIANFEEKLTDTDGSLVEQVKLFGEQMSKLSGEELEAFKQSYPELLELFEKGGGLLEKHGDIITEMGLSKEEFAALAAAAKEEGIGIEELLSNVTTLTEKNGDLSSSLVIVAANTDDATLSSMLYGLATGKALSEVANAATIAESSFKRISEAQEKFLKGDLNDSELLDLFDTHSDFFSSSDNLEAFMRGDDVATIAMIAERRKVYEDYEKQLVAIEAQLRTATGAEREQLEAKRNSIKALLAMRDPLRGVTSAQQKYNEALKRYETLKGLGFDDIEAQEKLLKALGNAMFDSISASQDSIKYAADQVDSSLYRVIDGVVVLTDAFYELSPAARVAAKEQIDALQNSLDAQTDIFKNYLEETLKLEQEKVNKAKRVYEDYFKALDKLEEKRERKANRKDLVAQLSRLEGATDEMSRKKALELRKELNKLDEDTRTSEIKDAREALTKSLDGFVDDMRAIFKEAWEDFMKSYDPTLTGQEQGEAFMAILNKYGISPEGFGQDIIRGKIREVISKIEPIKDRLEDIKYLLGGGARAEVYGRKVLGLTGKEWEKQLERSKELRDSLQAEIDSFEERYKVELQKAKEIGIDPRFYFEQYGSEYLSEYEQYLSNLSQRDHIESSVIPIVEEILAGYESDLAEYIAKLEQEESELNGTLVTLNDTLQSLEKALEEAVESEEVKRPPKRPPMITGGGPKFTKWKEGTPNLSGISTVKVNVTSSGPTLANSNNKTNITINANFNGDPKANGLEFERVLQKQGIVG